MIKVLILSYNKIFSELLHQYLSSLPEISMVGRVCPDEITQTHRLARPDIILSNTIKTANKKDLFIDVSLECGLYTDTLVKSKGGEKDTAMSDAGVMVRVFVDSDEKLALPGEVVFGRRTQTLSAVFGGILTEDSMVCTTTYDPEIGKYTTTCYIDYGEVTEEELELILQTMNANSFNFIMKDVTSDVHTVVVQAKIDLDTVLTDAQKGKAEAKALIGNGSVTI